jgi:hypothetical protein
MSPVRLLPWVLHEAIEYVAGAFFILAPFLFGFQDERAFPVFVGVGVLILAIAILSRGPAAVVDVLPHPVHAALDYLLAFFLLLAPFVFQFNNATARKLSIFLGLAHLIVTLVTRFPQAETPSEPQPEAGTGKRLA